jgi:hypothetical protein
MGAILALLCSVILGIITYWIGLPALIFVLSIIGLLIQIVQLCRHDLGRGKPRIDLSAPPELYPDQAYVSAPPTLATERQLETIIRFAGKA